MHHKWYIRTLAVFLALVICCMYPLRAAALGAEGVIIGGAGAAGIGLTMPQVAIIILAVSGAGYLVSAARNLGYDVGEELAESLIIDIRNSPHFNPDDWNKWHNDSTENGKIHLFGAPEWLYEAIKDWAGGWLSGEKYIDAPGLDAYGHALVNSGGTISAGSPAYSPAVGGSSGYTWSTFSHDVTKYGWYNHVSDGDTASIEYFIRYYAPYSGDKMTGLYHYERYSHTTTIKSIYEDSASGLQWCLYEGIWRGAVSSEDYSALMRNIVGFYDNTQTQYTAEEIIDMLSDGRLSTSVGVPTYPDFIVGGVADQVQNGVSMDDITLPDLIVPGTEVFPVSPSEGQTLGDAVVEYITSGLHYGQLTWEEVVKALSVYDESLGTSMPTVTIPNVDTGVNERFELNNDGVSDSPLAPVVPSVPSGEYTLDLTDFFPFCIPFDIYEFLSLLAAEPEAPVFEWVIPIPQLGLEFPISIDLSAWDSVAQLFRNFELLAFIVGLAMITRDKILRG